MKTSLLFSIITLLITLGISAQAQPSNENYIYTYDMMVPFVGSVSHGVPNDTALKTIQYFDGLGRPLQTVQVGFSHIGKDVIKPFEYDNFGIDTINYLPYPGEGSSGSYRSDFKAKQPDFYQSTYEDANGYAPTMIEKSPIQRTLKQGAPGASWQISNNGHPVTFQYLTNDNSSLLQVKKWRIDEDGSCKYDGLYPANELWVVKTVDEDLSASYEFKDKQSRVLLKRNLLSDTSFTDTYYIYDDLNLLRYVISPEGSERIQGGFSSTDDLVKQYVYCYQYDLRKRLIEKQIPGKAPEYYIYNKADQIILYQDGNMRKVVEGKNCYSWQFTKYDGLGRVIMTGITDQFPVESRDDIQALANNQNQCFETLQYATIYPQINSNYYTNRAFPTIGGDEKLLTLNYYDTYVINTSLGIKPIISESNMIFNTLDASFTLPDYEMNFTSGLQTIQYVEYNGTLWPTVSYYDTRGRLLQERSVNHKKGIEINNISYKNLTNLISASEHKHSTDIYGRKYEQTEKYTFSYSPEGRLLSRSYYLKDVLVQKLDFDYTPLGDQVIKKVYVEGSTVRQTVDYKFNIRGWLTKINDPANFTPTGEDHFAMELFYDQKLHDTIGTQRYNGNISSIRWQSKPPLGAANVELTGDKAYGFSYDKLNRLTGTSFYEVLEGKFQRTNAYQELINDYDLNGNIKKLKRQGKSYGSSTIIDNLTYTYTGNQVVGIDDAVIKGYDYDFFDNGHFYYISQTPEYLYDANGNLTQDLNKEILKITYNELNLPLTIDLTGNYKIEYKYDALGNKKCQMVSEGGRLFKTTDFIGNFVYENNYPAYHTFDEGRIVYKADSTYFAETYIKDHLGNIRVAYGNDGVKDGIRQVNAYYPFGMNMKELSANSSSTLHRNEYQYNGKMFQDELGLDWYDYGARFYDPVIGRWHSVDPKAADAPAWSPYRAFFCNPIRYSDPDGRWEWDATGNLVAQKGDQSYSLAKFLGTNQSNAMTILNRGGVTANDKGILNLKEGQTFAKSDLWLGFKSGSGPVVNNTSEALDHYYNGNGRAADVGDNSTVQLLTSDKFQFKHTKITSQEVVPKGDFSVDMKDKEGSFHIGSTGVDYSVSGNGKSSSVTYTLFTNTNKNSSNFSDGFWDPNIAAEITLGKLGINRYKADEMGPNLEWGNGQPYPYKTRERTFFFKPVEQ